MKQIFTLFIVLNSITTYAQQEDFLTDLTHPTGLVFNGNDLYFIEFSLSKISKIDITDTTPSATSVITGLDLPNELTFDGNDLYFPEYYNGKIFKIDITDTTPSPTNVISGLSGPISLLLNGNDLYIAEVNANKISKINISETTPTTTDVVTGINFPSSIVINGNSLYISARIDGKIIKFTLESMSINDVLMNNNEINLYPNPSDNYIKLLGLKNPEKYEIYNIHGAQINHGIVTEDHEEIDVSAMASGFYFLKFHNRNAIKFLKK